MKLLIGVFLFAGVIMFFGVLFAVLSGTPKTSGRTDRFTGVETTIGGYLITDTKTGQEYLAVLNYGIVKLEQQKVAAEKNQ